MLSATLKPSASPSPARSSLSNPIPCRHRSCGVEGPEYAPTAIAPLVTGSRPKIARSRRVRPAAEEAGDTENLAAVQGERRRTWHDAIQLQQRLAGGPRAVRVQLAQRPPHHHVDDVGGAGDGRDAAAGVPAVAQDDEAVRHRLHFLDEVRDVHDRHPLRLEPADEIEERPDVGRTEAAGRLVEDEDTAAGRERPRDLDELLRRRLRGSRPARPAEYRRDRAGASPRPRSRACACAARSRAGPARSQARCSPSRSGAGRATAPGGSSRRRRAAPRTDRAARKARRRSASSPRRARSRRRGSPSACSCRRRSARPARRLRPDRTASSARSSAMVAPNRLPTPRISKRGRARASAIATDPGAAVPSRRRRSCDRA